MPDGRTIGVLTPLVAGPYFGEILTGISREAAAAGHGVVVIQTLDPAVGDTHAGVPRLEGHVGWDHVAGFVVVTGAVSDAYLGALQRAGKAVVLISHQVADLSVPAVAPDNRGGVREAVAHLYAHAHRRIAFAGHLAQADLRERHEAYREALDELGLAATDELFFETGDNMEVGGERAGRAMLAAGLPSSAVVAGNDFNAVGIMRVLAAAGRRLPQDQAVVGFDDSPVAEHQHPALSSVNQRVEAVGAEGALLLLRAMAGESVRPGRHVVASSFVIRESCGCPTGVPTSPDRGRDAHGRREPPDQLAPRLYEQVFGGHGHAGAAELDAACATVGRLLAGVGRGEGPGTGGELDRALRSIYAARPRKETVAGVLTAVQDAAASLRDGAVDARLDDWVRDVALSLADARALGQARTTAHLQVALRNEYDISMDLLRAHEHAPDSLRWLAHSPVPAGCLALWTDVPGPGQPLEVVSGFGAQLDGSVVGATSIEAFPPAELIAVADREPGNLTFVLAVKTDRHNWGMLALVGLAETRTSSGRDTYFQWAAMLSVALDYQAMVQSLRTTIAERSALEARLRHQAMYDTLTDLPNRTLFLDRLGQAVERARRRDTRFAVLFLDLDGFKVVNDSLGHLTGDLLLREVAERIRSQIRRADTAARIGGDEFTVLLDDVEDLESVPAIAREIQDAIAAPYELQGHTLVVTATVGVATSVRCYDRAEDVLRDADIAMYRAKSDGRGSCAVFDASMHEAAMTRLRTESELRRAIDARELVLHYQPIVDLGTRELVGLEALVRWEHPERGLVLPGEFLPIAEVSGLIVPLGRSLITQACAQRQLWQAAGLEPSRVRVSLNVSNKEFWHPQLLNHIVDTLSAHDLGTEWLTIEITEGVLMSDVEQARQKLQDLHELGIRLHVDDFGTGYSSLEALHRFPIDALKIDRSFVAQLENDHRSRELARTIIMMGARLDLTVIAEGVETRRQRDCLLDLGCSYGQGYLFAAALPPSEVAGLLGLHPDRRAASG
jgi:diguanylate cyclase (GGDEF)-like protein